MRRPLMEFWTRSTRQASSTLFPPKKLFDIDQPCLCVIFRNRAYGTSGEAGAFQLVKDRRGYQRTVQSTISPSKWRPLKSDMARPLRPDIITPDRGRVCNRAEKRLRGFEEELVVADGRGASP